MRKRTKLSITLIILLLILISAAFLYARKWTRDFQEFMATKGSIEYAKANDIVITETKDNIKDWELYAAIGEYDATRVTVTLHDIVGNYYKDGEVVMSFVAPRGTYNSDTKEIKLLEDVKIVWKDNIILTANQVAWVTTEDKIKAKGNIVINKNNEIIALSNEGSVTSDFVFFELKDSAEIRLYQGLADKRIRQ